MARPRKHNNDLPKRVYFRHGAYYYVPPSGRWLRLGTDRDKALRMGDSLSNTDGGLLTHISKIVLPTARRNAKGRGLPFRLAEDDVIHTAVTAKWRCAVTGIKFTLDQVGKAKRKPYAPSIDRIDCSVGYEPANVRLVCVAVNIALGDWGDEVFSKLALYYAKRLFDQRYPEP